MFCRKVIRLLNFFFLLACFSCSLITNVYAKSLSTPSDYVDDDFLGDDVSLFSNPLELPKVSDEDLKEELGFNQPKPEPVSGHVSLFSAHIADKHAGGWKLLPGDSSAHKFPTSPENDERFLNFKHNAGDLTKASYFVFEFEGAGRKQFTKRVNFKDEDGIFTVNERIPQSAVYGITAFKIHIGKRNLPKPGNYSLKVFLSSELVDNWDFSIPYIRLNKLNKAGDYESFNIWYLNNDSQFGAMSNITIDEKVYSIDIILNLDSYKDRTMLHGVKIGFYEPETDLNALDNSTPGVVEDFNPENKTPEANAEDIANSTKDTADNTKDTANNTKAIVESQNLILGTLKAIIQHISDQLFAFWNQLAGEFTNLYAKLEKNANDNFTALKEAGKEATKHIVENDNKNTKEIKDNNDKNTDKALNSYNNSSMNNDNETLKNKIAEQDGLEKQITSKINEPLSSFEFKNPVNQYLLAFGMCGQWLQNLFDSLGDFKDVVNLSFAMTIALICIGMYRFKGGA